MVFQGVEGEVLGDWIKVWTSSAEWTGPPLPQTQNAPGSREFRAVDLRAFAGFAFAGLALGVLGFRFLALSGFGDTFAD